MIIIVTSRLSLIFFITSILLVSVLQGVSADRSDATEETILVDTDDADMHSLFTETGVSVEIWIEDLDGANENSAHPIDIYIVTWDQWWDHFCGGEDNQFAEDFTPAYSNEKLDVEADKPVHIVWTPQTDDSYYLVFDNCDNQRSTDYNMDVSSVIITFAVDDQSDEVGEGLLALLGGSVICCCGLPILFGIIVIILLVRLTRKKEVIVIQQQPSNLGYQPPPSN